MILATFDKAMQYAACHPGLLPGIRFLQTCDPLKLSDGKHEIDGKKLFAICAHDQGRGREGAVLESHRKYIDIQYVVSGKETMGWQAVEQCKQIQHPYNPETDLAFYSDTPASWFDVAPGSIAIFFPEDGHAPLAATGPLHKIVVKVAVDW
jgi:biofilm protein TabA